MSCRYHVDKYICRCENVSTTKYLKLLRPLPSPAATAALLFDPPLHLCVYMSCAHPGIADYSVIVAAVESCYGRCGSCCSVAARSTVVGGSGGYMFVDVASRVSST